MSKTTVLMVIGAILGVAIFSFLLQNWGVVDVKFWFWKLSMSLSLLIFLIFGGGVLMGWLFSLLLSRKKKKQIVENASNA